MGLKYEFTGETLNYDGYLLHRIRRLSDGKVGGWVEKEDNLSQEGSCWIDDEAKVFDEAKVYSKAKIYGEAKVYGNAKVYGDAEVYGNAKVGYKAKVYGEAKVYGNAEVYGNARIYGNAGVHDNARVYGNAQILEYAKIWDSAVVEGDAEVYGAARIGDEAYADGGKICGYSCVQGTVQVGGKAIISGYARVYGDAWIDGNAKIYGDAEIYGDAGIEGNIRVHGDMEIDHGHYNHGDYYGDSDEYADEECDAEYPKDYNENDLLEDSEAKEVVQDFIYKVDDSNKLITQTEYNSIDEFFDASIADDIKLDTLVICSVDTKEPLIKLQKVKADNRTEFKFIVEITNEDSDDFIFRSIIKSQDQLNQLIQKTIEALRLYPKFNKYADDLEEYL